MTVLSNRQRKALRRHLPKEARHVAAPAAEAKGPGPEPRGVALRAATANDLEVKEATRLGRPAQEGGLVDVHVERGLEGYLRAPNRDGLVSLHRSGSLSDTEAKAGLAFRLCYEASVRGQRSCLGKDGFAGGSKRVAGLARSAAELHRAYLLARLNQMERAVAVVMVDGRELHALREIAGEGKTVQQLGGSSGGAREAYKAALKRALSAIAEALRITGD